MDLTILWTIPEAAEHLRISPRTVYRLVEDGELKLVKVRGGSRITGDSLVAYLEKVTA